MSGDNSGFFDSIKSTLSRTENTDEEKLEKLKRKKAELEKKYKMKKMQRDIQKYKGEVEGRGTFGKLGAMVKDISKRGKPGQDSAISILVGPPEGQESTEEFVLGNSPSKRSEDVSSFILGEKVAGGKDPDFSFLLGSDKEDDLDNLMEEVVGV